MPAAPALARSRDRRSRPRPAARRRPRERPPACRLPRGHGTDTRARVARRARAAGASTARAWGWRSSRRAHPDASATARVAPDTCHVAEGALITIEGLDGAGKTTLAVWRSHAALLDRGLDVRLLREPGGVRRAERIRESSRIPSLEIGARAEALLYAAARAQLVEEAIAPLLTPGLGSCSIGSSTRRSPTRARAASSGSQRSRQINEFATRRSTAPTGRCCWRSAGSLGRARSRERSEPLDRLEREEEQFFVRIAGGLPRAVGRRPGADPQDRRTRALPEAVLKAALASARGPRLNARAAA